MQLSNAPAKLTLPFANSGNKRTIPVPSQVGITAGAASFTDGFPPLTFLEVDAGGIPPAGQDFNGVLFDLSTILLWESAGGLFQWDSVFAADSNTGGYPKGATVLSTDSGGLWGSTADNNTVNPETDATGKWLPRGFGDLSSIAMASANVTLTNLQAARPMIVITGTLTTNLNLVFPTWIKEWHVVNNATGAFSVTCKTASGTGIAVGTGSIQYVYGDGTNIVSLKPTTSPTFTEVSISSNTALGSSNTGNNYVATAALTLTIAQSTGLATTWTDTVFAFGGNVTLSINGSDKINGGSVGVGLVIPKGYFATLTTDASSNIYVEMGWANIANVTLASATTTDLGTAGSPNVTVSGVTTITGFGSSAQPGQMFNVTFSGSLTLTNSANILLQGAQNIVTQANDTAMVLCTAANTYLVVYNRYSGISGFTQANFKNLSLSAAGLAASVAVSYDALVLADGNGNFASETGVSGTITTTATGANGLDTGALAASTWYSVWRIGKADGTRAWLFSLSATAPTMPSGYTLKARIGWFRTDGTGNKFPLSFKQLGRRWQYVVAAGSNVTALPIPASGAQGNTGTPTWVAIALANFIPSTASVGFFVIGANSAGTMIAPNNAYGAINSTTNSPPGAVNSGAGSNFSITQPILLESTNIYYAAGGASSFCSVLGWEDNI